MQQTKTQNAQIALTEAERKIAKKYTSFAAILASLPLTSILAFIWLYRNTKDKQKIIDPSYGIFWMVLPSLLFFIVLPMLLKKGMGFGWAIISSCGGLSRITSKSIGYKCEGIIGINKNNTSYKIYDFKSPY